MGANRTDRLNSLLKEVISDVIRKDVRNPDVHHLFTLTRVEITKDLRHAKVYVSVLASAEEQSKTLAALNKGAGFIAVNASKQVVMRFFPELRFFLDNSAEEAMRIEELLSEVNEERESRES